MGDLGAGKSELARVVIRELAGSEIEVPSPSFTLLQVYALPALLVGHADLYRIGDAREVAGLGLDEIVGHGALLVEWPERAHGALPGDPLLLTLADADGSDARWLTIEAPVNWTERARSLLP